MDGKEKLPWRTAGWWVAIGLGLACAGLPIILANSLIIGWGFGAGALVAFGVAGWTLVRPKKRQAVPRVTPVISIPEGLRSEEDNEINMQEAFELICGRLNVPRHGHDTKSTDARLNIFHELRQKARDGAIVIRGREQPFGALLGMYKPRENIPAEHWKNMDFDSVRYIFATEPQTIVEAATEADHKDLKGNPNPYVDLMVSKAAVEKAWPPRPAASSWMISVVDFLAAAEKHGWSFGPTSVDVNKLQVGLREAAVNGRVQVYGRKYTSVASITRNEPRVPIPAEIWKTNWMILLAVLHPMNGENFDTAAQEPMSKPSYVDLHFGGEVLDWLKNDAEQYRNVKFK